MWILCLAEESLETSSLIFSEKQWKKYLWMTSAAVVIGALRVKTALCCYPSEQATSVQCLPNIVQMSMMFGQLWADLVTSSIHWDSSAMFKRVVKPSPEYIHVIPPWSSWSLQEMSHKILLKYITFYQNFEISRKWMENILIYSIHFSKTSRKWKKNLPDASLKFITCMRICENNYNLHHGDILRNILQPPEKWKKEDLPAFTPMRTSMRTNTVRSLVSFILKQTKVNEHKRCMHDACFMALALIVS